MSFVPRSVYIANGNASRDRLGSLVRQGEDVVLAHIDDVLSVGPLTADVTHADWVSLRRTYTAEAFGEIVCEALWLPPKVISEPYTPTFWMGAGTPDHVTLAWLYQVLAQGAGNRDRLRVAQYYVPTRVGPSQSIAILGAELDKKPEVSEAAAHHDYLEGAWQALTSESPSLLEGFVNRPSPPSLPFFGAALAERLRQYPSAETGLSGWDASLLKHVARHPTRLALAIGHVLAETFERLDYIGDAWLLGRLRGMARQPNPLVALDGDVHSIRDCSAKLTEIGKAVLTGKVNALDIRPCDDWVGGVRLDTGKAVWCLAKDGSIRLREVA